LQKDINLGDIIVTSAAIREEGTSSLYVSPQFPSVCDPAVLWDAYGHLSATGLKTHVGITWTTDGRYVESDEKVRFFSEHGVLNVDMESSAFLIVTWMKKIKAISVGIVVDRPVDDISSDYKGKKDYKTYKSRLSRVVGQVVLSLLEW
jgi:uridine phosphorylase